MKCYGCGKKADGRDWKTKKPICHKCSKALDWHREHKTFEVEFNNGFHNIFPDLLAEHFKEGDFLKIVVSKKEAEQ